MKIHQKYTCLLYGEGRKDKNFLITLIELDKFKYHTKKWTPSYANSHGCSPENVLKDCKTYITSVDFDLVVCFIDLDVLKKDYKDWEKEKDKLEKKYCNEKFFIIWQIDNIEDEFKKVLGELRIGKSKLNKFAKENVEKFINSDFWHKILNVIKNREKKLDEKLKLEEEKQILDTY